MPWLTGTDDLETVREFWPTVDEVDPAQLPRLLASARVQCEDYAPSLVRTIDGVDVVLEPPVNYLQAQALQARALFRSTEAGRGDQLGPDGFAVTVFPMDWTVKLLLRPRRGVPVIA